MSYRTWQRLSRIAIGTLSTLVLGIAAFTELMYG